MGTNYYLIKNQCAHCKRGEQVHIGKSSLGWCFSLHVIPSEGINSLDDWRPLFAAGSIKNEYDEIVTVDEMLDVIINRKGKEVGLQPPSGYAFWEEFLTKNSAVLGPHHLLRHRLDSSHCVDHGAGTWDCIIGDFS